MAWTMVSFCMSVPRKKSMENSKNSHSTPMVMEKQKATTARYTGDRVKASFSLRLRMSRREKPMAAHRKPLRVWSMVSQ